MTLSQDCIALQNSINQANEALAQTQTELAAAQQTWTNYLMGIVNLTPTEIENLQGDIARINNNINQYTTLLQELRNELGNANCNIISCPNGDSTGIEPFRIPQAEYNQGEYDSVMASLQTCIDAIQAAIDALTEEINKIRECLRKILVPLGQLEEGVAVGRGGANLNAWINDFNASFADGTCIGPIVFPANIISLKAKQDFLHKALKETLKQKADSLRAQENKAMRKRNSLMRKKGDVQGTRNTFMDEVNRKQSEINQTLNTLYGNDTFFTKNIDGVNIQFVAWKFYDNPSQTVDTALFSEDEKKALIDVDYTTNPPTCKIKLGEVERVIKEKVGPLNICAKDRPANGDAPPGYMYPISASASISRSLTTNQSLLDAFNTALEKAKNSRAYPIDVWSDMRWNPNDTVDPATGEFGALSCADPGSVGFSINPIPPTNMTGSCTACKGAQ